MGVGGLPVNPPPCGREFRGLLTFESTCEPLCFVWNVSGMFAREVCFTHHWGRGLPVNPPASRILNRPNPPTQGQGG